MPDWRANVEPGVTVGIVTKDRPCALGQCLRSLSLIGAHLAQVIVIDDTGAAPLADVLQSLPQSVAVKVRLLRQASHEGYIVARNRIMREATTDYVLLMDDDAWLLDGDGVREGLALLANCPKLGAVAFAMAGADGAPWDDYLQPAAVKYRCLVPAFIGFAHLLRRQLFLQMGGYRESFQSYGEEKDFCLRLMDAGFDVVYLPDRRVVHVPDPAGRVYVKYLRHTIRNDCLAALYNEPLPLPLFTVPIRLTRYRRMRGLSDRDPGGLRWIVFELLSGFRQTMNDRYPVRWTTIRKWRRLRREVPRWIPEAVRGAGDDRAGLNQPVIEPAMTSVAP